MNKSLFQQSLSGHFYAVGIGPGSPDMMTVRAQRIIETADVIIAPRSKMARHSMALNTVTALISKQHVVDCVYPMNRDGAATAAFWNDIACQSADWCRANKSVVHITIGDPLIYSTSCYILQSLEKMIPSKYIHVLPGISAFQAASAIFKEALTMQEDRLMLMPATEMNRVEEALECCETLVLYKVGQRIETLCRLLEDRGLDECARLVCYAEDAVRQYTTRTIRNAVKEQPGYMSTVIVHLNRCRWEDVPPMYKAQQ